MSASNLFIKEGFISNNAPLKNGLGRYIPQLMRVTIKFCKESTTSHGVRDFIEHDIVQFAKQNPGTAIYLKPRRMRSPVVVAEYLNGEKHWQSFHMLGHQEVREWMDLARNSSGKEYQHQSKYEFSHNPSIQGMWHPFVNVCPSVATAKFPDASLSEPIGSSKSASQHLIEMFEAQKVKQKSISSSENEQLESTKQSTKDQD